MLFTKKSHWLPVLLALAVMPAFAEPACAAGAGGTEVCWVLSQRSCTLGPVTVYVGPKSYKWFNDKLGLSFIATAPYQQMLVHNIHNKRYMRVTIDEAVKLFGGHGKAHKGKWVEEKKGKEVRIISGMKASRYNYALSKYWGGSEESKPAGKGGKNGAKNAAKNSGKNGAEKNLGEEMDGDNCRVADKKKDSYKGKELWLAQDVFLPPPVARVIERQVGIIVQHPMLRDCEFGADGKKLMLYDTLHAEKKPVDRSVFECPKGFQKATNHIALLMDTDDDSPLGMFADDARKKPPGSADLNSSPF